MLHTPLQSLIVALCCLAQGRRHEREVRVVGEHSGVHALVRSRIQVRISVRSFVEPEAEGGGEVLLIPEEHVDQADEAAIGQGGCRRAAASLPERRPVIEVERHDRAVAARCGHRLQRDVGGIVGKRREDPAAVEPARSVATEGAIPVHVARPELRGRGAATIGAAEGSPNAEAALNEVQPVPHASADTVVGHPAHVGLVDTALQDQIFEQPPDRVVRERGDNRGAKPEAATEPSCDVVLASALRDGERPRRRDPAVTWVEAQHHLAERHEVEPAVLARAELHAGTSRGASRARRSISANRPSRSRTGSQIHVPPQASTEGSAR